MKKLTFITGNKNKFEEINKLFLKEQLNIDLINQNLEMVEIQANSLEEVAISKINSIKNKVKGSFFIEDAGFFVTQLKGFPGVYSHYVMETIANEGILKILKDSKSRKAKFQAVIAYYNEKNDDIHTFMGEVLGSIAMKIRGSNGFGFDPIFIPDEIPNKTFGELSAIEKNEHSHRARASIKLISYLKNQ